MRKNFKVATTEDGKTTLTKIDKTPTGKVKKIEDTKKRREAREEQYRQFRIRALVRRGQRMKLPEQEIEDLKKLLLKQMDEPKQYTILCLFPTKTPTKKGEASIANLAKQAILNSKIEYKLLVDTYAYIIGDEKVLAKLREILPEGVTIHPYPKKQASVFNMVDKPKQEKKPSGNNKDVAAKAKAARKTAKIAYNTNRPKRAGKKARRIEKKTTLVERRNSRKAKIVQAVNKKPSESLKKASKSNMKQAAQKGGYHEKESLAKKVCSNCSQRPPVYR